MVRIVRPLQRGGPDAQGGCRRGQGTGPAVTGTEYVVYIENVDENSGSKTPSVAGRVEGSLKLVDP
jgi:hypothetical protein